VTTADLLRRAICALAVFNGPKGRDSQANDPKAGSERGSVMAGKNVGGWLKSLMGGRGKHSSDASGAREGMSVMGNEGTVLGTITMVWRGADATDGAPHDDTFGVRKADADDTSMMFIPSTAVARITDKGVTLTVDGTQVGPRGWRFRPAWLRADESSAEGRAGWGN
jgi:hypothetical protein